VEERGRRLEQTGRRLRQLKELKARAEKAEGESNALRLEVQRLEGRLRRADRHKAQAVAHVQARMTTLLNVTEALRKAEVAALQRKLAQMGAPRPAPHRCPYAACAVHLPTEAALNEHFQRNKHDPVPNADGSVTVTDGDLGAPVKCWRCGCPKS
jgi:regulator of replication initiation timing